MCRFADVRMKKRKQMENYVILLYKSESLAESIGPARR
jgi:hypothetical protein